MRSRHLCREFNFFSSLNVLSLFLACLLQLRLSTQCWLEMMKVDTFVLFLLLEEKLSVCHHGVWCYLWAFHIWPLSHLVSSLLVSVYWVFSSRTCVKFFCFGINCDDQVGFFPLIQLAWCIACVLACVASVMSNMLILCNPMDYSLPGSSVHGIL